MKSKKVNCLELNFINQIKLLDSRSKIVVIFCDFIIAIIVQTKVATIVNFSQTQALKSRKI